MSKWFLMLARIMLPSSSGSKIVVGMATQRSEGVSNPNLPPSTLRSLPPSTTPNGLPPPTTCYPHPHTLPIYCVLHETWWTDQSWRWRQSSLIQSTAFQTSALHITPQKTSSTILIYIVVHFPLIYCYIVDIQAFVISVFSHCYKSLNELTVSHTSMLYHILNDLAYFQQTHTVSSVRQMHHVFSNNILSGAVCQTQQYSLRCCMSDTTTFHQVLYVRHNNILSGAVCQTQQLSIRCCMSDTTTFCHSNKHLWQWQLVSTKLTRTAYLQAETWTQDLPSTKQQ